MHRRSRGSRAPSSRARSATRETGSRAATARDAGDRPAGPLGAARAGGRSVGPAGPPCSWLRPAPARRRSSRSRWPAPCRDGSSSPSPAGWPPAPPRAGWPRCWVSPSAGGSATASAATAGAAPRPASRWSPPACSSGGCRPTRSCPGVDAVVLDECHERHLDTDLALAFCLDVRAALRPDLQLVAMSATAQAQRLAALLGADGDPAPVVEAPGALHEVDVVWAPPATPGRPARTASGSTRGCSRTSPRPSAGRWPSRPATCWSSCPAPARSAPSPDG